MQLQCNYIDKLNFLETFKPACVAALSSSNIYNGFTPDELV